MSFRSRSLTETKMPRAITSRWILENQISTWLSQEEYVGVFPTNLIGSERRAPQQEFGASSTRRKSRAVLRPVVRVPGAAKTFLRPHAQHLQQEVAIKATV